MGLGLGLGLGIGLGFGDVLFEGVEPRSHLVAERLGSVPHLAAAALRRSFEAPLVIARALRHLVRGRGRVIGSGLECLPSS